VVLPETSHPWRVRLSDLDTGNILYETELKAGRVNSTKRYYVRFRLEAWQQGENVFAHDYSAADRIPGLPGSGTPVVLISGFSLPNTEFDTPYRVINYHACNGCWNDPKLRFDHKDFLWCPRHAGTPRQLECTRLITAEQVKQTLRRVPGFGVSTSGEQIMESTP